MLFQEETVTVSYEVENGEGEYLGSGEGYYCDFDAENWANYLKGHWKNKEVEEIEGYLAEMEISKVGIIENIYVNEENRNEGFGNEILGGLLNEFENNGVEFIILIADTQEYNDISLVEWYEGYGFYLSESSNLKDNPVMYLSTK